MTYKKTNLASIFTIVLTVLSTLTIYVLVFGLLIGWKGQEQQGVEGIGVAVIFILGLIFGSVAAVLGLGFSIPAAIMYKKSAKSGKLPTAAYILSTLATLVYAAFFIIAAIILFDIAMGYTLILGGIAVTVAALNLAVGIFAWISRRELV